MTIEEKVGNGEDELAKLFPEPLAVPIGGGVTLHVPAMDLATCIRFSKKARPIIEPLIMAGKQVSLDSTLASLWPALVNSPDNLLPEVLAIALGKTPELIGRLPPGALWPLMSAVVVVNLDFFARSVGSLVSGAQEKTTENPAADGAGLTH